MTSAVTTNYQKHVSSNPVQRWLINRFTKRLIAYVQSCGSIKRVLDAGCGEGFTLHAFEIAGVTAQFSGIDNVQAALDLGRKQFPTLDLKKGDIYALDFADQSVDVVLCTEVLEHLEKPEAALAELIRVSRKFIILSVPHEPWFMLANFFRGKYVARWGNHPEHINHWTGDEFIRLLRDAGLGIVRIESPFPWTLVLGEKR